MPQKRNPDAAELVRAKVGRIAGAFQGLLHGDEGPAARLFQGHAGGQGGDVRRPRACALAIAAMTGMVEDMEPVPEAMRAAAGGGYSTATDLADWLVRELKLPFRDAHHVTGAIVKAAEAKAWTSGKPAAGGHAGGGAAHHRRTCFRC